MDNQQIGWGTESKLLQTIGKQLERLTALIKTVVGTIPTHLYQLIDDALHRTVTDAEKAIWNASSSPFTPDEIDAVTGANSPSAANVFITENDISPAAVAALPSAIDLTGVELIQTVQGGVFVTATPAQIKTYVNLNSANVWGYVNAYANLPLGIASTDPEIGDLVGVNTTTGTWILGTQRRMGFYKRSALTGVAAADYGTQPYTDFSPVDITTSTDTNLTGLIAGDGSKIKVASAGTDYQAPLTFGIADTNKVQIDSATVANGEFAKFTATGLESRTGAEVLSDIGAQPAGVYLTDVVNDTTPQLGGNLDTQGNVIIGGTAVGSTLSLKSTTANGTLTAKGLSVLVGNNGGTAAVTVLNNGNVGIGTTAPTTNLNVFASYAISGVGNGIQIDKGAAGFAVVGFGGRTSAFAGNAMFYSDENYMAINSKAGSKLYLNFDNSNAASDVVFFTNKVVVKQSGNVGIGTAGPTAVLHLKAGTATANTAPLKLTSGTLNTVAEAGAVEFLTDDFWATITTGAVRKRFSFTEDSPHLINKVASANIRNSHDAEATSTSATYVKVKTITLSKGLIGQQRFLFDIKTSNAGVDLAYGKIYRNGVALGTEQSDTTGSYVTKSEDLTQTWLPGDTCELWVKIANASTVSVQNFRIAYDDSPTIAVTSVNS